MDSVGSGFDADGHWVAGLTDGEGCFVFYVRKRKTGPSYIRIDFTFRLSLRADDAATIEMARKILGVGGSVYRTSTARGPNGHPVYSLAVQRKAEVATVIQFFRRYPLRSKKKRDFDLWAKAFEIFDAGIKSHELRSVSLGRQQKRSRTGVRRPPAGTKRKRFRTVPPEMVAELTTLADQLVNIRSFA